MQKDGTRKTLKTEDTYRSGSPPDSLRKMGKQEKMYFRRSKDKMGGYTATKVQSTKKKRGIAKSASPKTTEKYQTVVYGQELGKASKSQFVEKKRGCEKKKVRS